MFFFCCTALKPKLKWSIRSKLCWEKKKQLKPVYRKGSELITTLCVAIPNPAAEKASMHPMRNCLHRNMAKGRLLGLAQELSARTIGHGAKAHRSLCRNCDYSHKLFNIRHAIALIDKVGGCGKSIVIGKDLCPMPCARTWFPNVAKRDLKKLSTAFGSEA